MSSLVCGEEFSMHLCLETSIPGIGLECIRPCYPYFQKEAIAARET